MQHVMHFPRYHLALTQCVLHDCRVHYSINSPLGMCRSALALPVASCQFTRCVALRMDRRQCFNLRFNKSYKFSHFNDLWMESSICAVVIFILNTYRGYGYVNDRTCEIAFEIRKCFSHRAAVQSTPCRQN